MSLNITTNLEGLETHQNDKELSQTGNNGTSVIFSSKTRVKTLFKEQFSVLFPQDVIDDINFDSRFRY